MATRHKKPGPIRKATETLLGGVAGIGAVTAVATVLHSGASATTTAQADAPNPAGPVSTAAGAPVDTAPAPAAATVAPTSAAAAGPDAGTKQNQTSYTPRHATTPAGPQNGPQNGPQARLLDGGLQPPPSANTGSPVPPGPPPSSPAPRDRPGSPTPSGPSTGTGGQPGTPPASTPPAGGSQGPGSDDPLGSLLGGVGSVLGSLGGVVGGLLGGKP